MGLSVGALQNRLRYGWEEDRLLEPKQVHLKMSKHEMRLEILKLRKQLEEYKTKIENGTLVELPRMLTYVDYCYGIEKYVVEWIDNGRVKSRTYWSEKKAEKKLKELGE